jgi:N-acetyl-alpha-D-muramate 1-phosphate uridylyltransferase
VNPNAKPAPLRAIVLAAGRGERMRPLTDRTPKPLLAVRGKPLIAWHLEALARAGVREVIVNTAWLEEQFPAALGDGSRFGLAIVYSAESRDHGGALETAGGIAKALPWLTAGGQDAFWVVSADIWAPQFQYDAALAARFAGTDLLAHLWLVPNPPFHPRGDFGLGEAGALPQLNERAAWGLGEPSSPDGTRWTYANFALMRAALCSHITAGTRMPLAPLLFEGMRQRRISAEIYRGRWDNIGTADQLAALNAPG